METDDQANMQRKEYRPNFPGHSPKPDGWDEWNSHEKLDHLDAVGLTLSFLSIDTFFCASGVSVFAESPVK